MLTGDLLLLLLLSFPPACLLVGDGRSLFSADVTAAMGGRHTVQTESLSNLYIQLMAMPGYILGILLIVRGRSVGGGEIVPASVVVMVKDRRE